MRLARTSQLAVVACLCLLGQPMAEVTATATDLMQRLKAAIEQQEQRWAAQHVRMFQQSSLPLWL